MRTACDVLDRGVPDATPTAGLPNVLAAEVDLLAGRWERWVGPDVEPGLRARALLVAGRPGDARRALGQPGVVDAAVQGIAAAVWASSRVGATPEVRDGLEARLVDATGFLEEDGIVFGPAALFRALLAVQVGAVDEASDLLASAALVGDARSPSWGARTRLEWARVLGTLAEVTERRDDGNGVGPPEAGRIERDRVLRSAQMFFVAGGYRHLTQVAGGLLAAPPIAARAEPTLGHLVPGSRWSIGFGVQPPIEVRASKGLVALRHLIDQRGRAVPAVELEAVADGRLDEAERIVRDLVDLRSGEVDGDGGQLAVRLHDDRARSSISKLLHRTIGRVGDHHRTLARHLQVAVEPGYLCRYVGGPSVVWRLDGGEGP